LRGTVSRANPFRKKRVKAALNGVAVSSLRFGSQALPKLDDLIARVHASHASESY
jgi:hypothetical protein